NSIHNLDFGWRAEGLAVIDSLRRIVSHWQSTTGDFPIDLKKIPDWNFVESNSRAKAKTAPGGPVEIEIASAGKLPMEKPHTYSKAKLTERAQLGKKIIISAEQASKPAVQETLAMAVENGSRVWVIESANEDKEAFAPTKKALKDMGVQVFHEGDVILEDSYFELVCRELDQAIRDKSPIQMAAFALSHPEIIDRLIAAHDAGSDVRVVVDDLQIDGSLINKKAMAQLSAAGVPVRGVDRDVKAEIAREWGGDAPQLKLHAKYLGVGGDRVLAGSANFSDNGMSNNVEDGRLIRSEAVAKKVSDTLFEPLWAKSKPVEPIRVVPDHQRVPLLDPVPAGTPPSDVTIVVMDLETTGFVAKHDDRLLQISARAMKLGADGEVEVLEDFDQVVTPGINQLGHPFAIPKQISALVGLDESNLESRGALPVQEAVLAFIEFIGRQKEGGPTILAGQNLPFDIRFLDHVLSREQLGVPKGDDTVHYTLDGPYMDCIDISKRAFPEADSHNLDAHMARLDVPLDPKLPRHDAFPDVVYTSEVLGKLIFKVEAKAIDTLLPPDLIELDGPRMLFSSPRKSGNALHELNFNDKDKLQIEVRDPRSGKLGGSKRVYDLQVTGRKNGRLEVAVTTGRGDRTEVTKGWIDEGNLTFRSGGRFYHKMRQEGQALPKPTILTS
ncbi:MAG: phospholipase D-like domain-containing protein, partial [Myxococcota bacterium]